MSNIRHPWRLTAGLIITISCMFTCCIDISIYQVKLHLTGSVFPDDYRSFRYDALLVLHQLKGGDFLPYPPSFLVLSIPFNLLPIWPSCIAWLAAGPLAIALAGRRLGFSAATIALALLSPPSLFCLTVGQCSMFVSAALLLALGLADTAPVLAGIAAGCVAIKPLSGVLLPIVYIASRNGRAFVAALCTTLVMCALPTIAFGPGIWHLFSTQHVSGAASLVGASWPRAFQLTHITIFMLLRSLGAGLHLAGALQAVSSLIAIIICWQLWRPQHGLSLESRLAATLCLLPLTIPYADVYDQVALALALSNLAATSGWTRLAPFTLLCVFTSIYLFITITSFSAGALFIIIILGLVWPWRHRLVPLPGAH